MERPESDERKVAQALAKRRAEGWLEVIDGDAEVTEGLRQAARQGGTGSSHPPHALPETNPGCHQPSAPRNIKAACEHPKPMLRRNQVDTE
jgi:hypothetical protein